MESVLNALGGMDTFMNSLGIDALGDAGIALKIAAIIQSVLIMFFFVAPILGLMVARSTADKGDALIAWGLGVLVMLIGTFGIAYVLRHLIPEDVLPNGIFSLLMGLGGISAGWLIGRYMAWHLAAPGEPPWVRQFREEVAQNQTALEAGQRHIRKSQAQEKINQQRAQRAQKSIYNRKKS
jgi:hypothetical protein